ncbi:hypothetical protein SCLCIDRAFT_22472 [Scleroderma citrinum Foug A]|uniref:Uncharacterized protein n=1 Tax=Scleroderma citrinum Foug A TaxID=1036808 RepID=A0A0C3EDG9_9AGAM|nr:hypothetical protein SCLCIDRAFT_22472 [Scleroderma citrinum Foug A]
MPEALVTASNDLENLDCGDIPRMYLRSTNWCAGDPNGLGSQMDGLSCEADVLTGQADVLRGWMETLSMSDSPELASISCGDNLGTYLGAGGAKCSAEVTEGFRSHMDPSSTRTGVLSAGTDVNMTVNEAETISMRPVQLKLPKPPTGGKNGHVDETDGSRNHLSMSSTHMDVYTIGNTMETTTNMQEIVSMRPIVSKWPNLLTKGANACANEPSSCRDPVEMLTGHREAPSVATDGDTTANATETVRILRIESKLQKSPIETAKQSANEMNGRGNGSDASSRCADVHSAGNKVQTAIFEAKSVRTPPNEPKMQNSPAGAERRRAGVAEGFRSHTDMLTMRKDTHNIAHDMGTAENVSRNVRSHQNGPKTKNSPNADEFVTPKRADQRR